MIYDKLRILPKIIQIEIIETGDLTLLSDEDITIEKLASIWSDLMQEFKEKYDAKNQNKVFNIYREIGFLEKKYTIIKCAVEALGFDFHQQLIDMLKDYGYTLTEENYVEDLKRILRESEGIIIKINKFIDQLPKPVEQSNTTEGTIIDSMAMYSAILSIDFDYNTISVVKFHALEKQVKQKIAALEKSNAKNKK